MSVSTAAVLLWAWGTPVSVRDRSWYEEYFFDQAHGHASYWLKQSDGNLLLDGTVFDWVFDSSPNRDFSNRRGVAEMAIEHMESAHDVDFSDFDIVVVVLGVPKTKYGNVNGGSTLAESSTRSHNAVITRLDDPFDFICHELGHAVGLEHSFTWDKSFQVVGENPGGYGHPHCIMSAMVYGGFAQARHNSSLPFGSIDEYRNIGPSLNGVAALSRQWIDATTVSLTPGFKGEVEVRARQWLGRDPGLPPQAIHLLSPDGSDHVVEFYEGLDFDQGLQASRLIITQDRGGLADTHYPGRHTGTFIASLALPAALTGSAAVINAPGPIGLVPLFYDPVRHVLRVQISAGAVSGWAIDVAASESTESTVVESGTVTFEPGERFCITGTWAYDMLENRQIHTIEVSHPRFIAGSSSVEWKIDGAPCSDSPIAAAKMVSVANPKRLDITQLALVEIGFTVEATELGSKLTLHNRPEDETFSISVEATVSTSVARSRAECDVEFVGRQCQFLDDFQTKYSACHAEFIKKKVEDTTFRVIFDPAKIRRVPSPLREELYGWLGGLADLLDKGDQAGFDTAAAALRSRLAMPDARLLTFELGDRSTFEPLTEEIRTAPNEWRRTL